LRERRGDVEPAIAKFIEASGRESRKAERAWAWMQRAVVVSMLLVIGGLVAYINQAWLREQYHRQFIMGIDVLSPEVEKQKASKPGSAFKECANGCPTMIVVLADEFKMCSPPGQGFKDEVPQHEVTIPVPFAVGRTEVTFAEWDVCVQAGAFPSR
jgi:formylglycine-generating enzyme required for sulfatase activity